MSRVEKKVFEDIKHDKWGHSLAKKRIKGVMKFIILVDLFINITTNLVYLWLILRKKIFPEKMHFHYKLFVINMLCALLYFKSGF